MAGSSITSIVSEQKCSVGRVGALARRLPCFTAEAPPGGVGVGGPRIALPPDEDDWLGLRRLARLLELREGLVVRRDHPGELQLLGVELGRLERTGCWRRASRWPWSLSCNDMWY